MTRTFYDRNFKRTKDHALTWIVVKGKVQFIDYQASLYTKNSGRFRINVYDAWNQIFSINGIRFEEFSYIRLDDCKPDYNLLQNFVKLQD